MPQKAIQIRDHTSTQLTSTQLSSAFFSLNLAVGTFPYLRKVLNFDREKRNTLKNQSSVDKTKAFRLQGTMWVHRRKAFRAIAKHNTPLSETLNHVKFIRKRAARRESSRQVIRGFAESHPRVCLCARLGKQRNRIFAFTIALVRGEIPTQRDSRLLFEISMSKNQSWWEIKKLVSREKDLPIRAWLFRV